MIPETPAMPFIAICCLGVLSYLILLLVTSQVFHRVPTAELFLMTAWAVLELVVVSALKGTVFLPPGDITIYAIIFIATGIGLAAYMAYYSLDEMLAYYCGMVPLLVNMAAMWVIIRKISSM